MKWLKTYLREVTGETWTFVGLLTAYFNKELLMPDEMPLLMLPSNSQITINTRFKINSKY